MKIQITDEMQAILDYTAKPGSQPGHLLINALAGCGKTTTLLELLKVIPQRSILMCAFNKRIADEIKIRMPRLPRTHGAHVLTFHALGNKILSTHFPKMRLDQDATEGLINEVAPRIPFKIRRASTRILRMIKETLPTYANSGSTEAQAMIAEDVLVLGWEHDIFSMGKLNDRDTTQVAMIVQQAYATHAASFGKRETFDFCDMIWAPLELRLEPPSRYQAIVIDELQDIAVPQWALLHMVALKQTRWIAAGDLHQQIYQWRGSMGHTIWRDFEDMDARTLPLTMTWRCSTEVVKEANKIVPELRARLDADEGSIININMGELPSSIAQGPSAKIHTFVLSRTNADLLDAAMFMWRERVGFQLNAGQQMLEPLFYLLDQVLVLTNEEAFKKSLDGWYAKEKEKADKAGAVAWLERVTEQYRMLKVAVRHAKPSAIKKLLKDILAEGQTGVLLSTVHKVKGLEAERVFLLKQTFGNRRRDDERVVVTDPDGYEHAVSGTRVVSEEEVNIEYVAITRAREHLIWVNLDNQDTDIEYPGEHEEQDLNEMSSDDLEQLMIDLERKLQRESDERAAKRLHQVIAVLDERRVRVGTECDHGVKFDAKRAAGLSVQKIRELFPRLVGTCKRCGFEGIVYASQEHYVAGDW